MSKYSDHNKPQFDLNKYLPEVYRSDVNTSVFDMAFNRHLTKDDTQRVAGIIGTSSPNALVKRQIQEPTPHRQAYQLAPTMYSQVGTVENALSFKAFLQQLELIGVDVSRIQTWADALQFNWVPPINIDMFVNYQDYFWNPNVPSETPHYFTVENRCNKAKTKLSSYDNLLQQRGETFSVLSANFELNAFVVSSKVDDLFVDGFLFFTKNTTNVNLDQKFWTVQSSSYDQDKNETTITVVEPIAAHSAFAPETSVVGQWWYDTTTSTLHQWNGSSWPLSTRAVSVVISLAELRAVYQTETNCACAQDLGWDVGQWDDNQTGAVLWNAELFSTPTNANPSKRIDFATESDWIDWNTEHPQNPVVLTGNTPALNAIWFDTTSDELKQYANGWKTVVGNFSAVKDKTQGNALWDLTIGCDPQQLNQWSAQNRWLHKTQVRSFSGVRRAQMPILEYSSTLEMNEWAQVTRSWKYRGQTDKQFSTVTVEPNRIELEPVKGFVVTNVGGVWYVYLFDKAMSGARDINHTSAFVLGYQFRVVDDGVMSDVYTVSSSEYREVTAQDGNTVMNAIGAGYVCTVVALADSTFSSSIQGGGSTHVRIEPLITSQGDPWRGYHLHWMLDETVKSTAPISSQAWNLLRKQDQTTDPVIEVVAGNSVYQALGFKPINTATVEIGLAHQQMTLSVPNVMQIDLVPKFQFDGTSRNLYVLPNSSDLRVYLNGVRQYGNYVERTASTTVDYTLIGQFAHDNTGTVEYVTGITFDRPLKALDTVRIEVGPASFSDMGNYCVPVRTVEDETAFAQAVASGSQPAYRSLSKFVLFEQQKTKANDYPLFNVYDLVTGKVVKAAPIFSYKEDPAAAINSVLQRRIAISEGGRDFDFKQDLVDRDDNMLYGYRDTAVQLSFWFNPGSNTLLYWDEHGWSNVVPVVTDGITTYKTPVVSNVEPVGLRSVGNSFWYDTQTNTLNRSSGVWNAIDVVVSACDPSLRTVWQKGSNNERAIPKYVDKDRKEVDLGSADGDWGIVDQWVYNVEHKNKQVVKYSQLLTHFNSIIKHQPLVPGLQGGGAYTLAQANYNYGVGGTIKEHNDSFDTLISAVNVTNTTPTGVLEYAGKQYTSLILKVRELFTKHAATLVTDYSPAAMIDLSAFVTAQVIKTYQDNDALAQIFGDSSSYDPATKVGVKNWIATAPMFGLAAAHKPHINKTGQFIEVVHHDGHRSTMSFSSLEIDKLARIICGRIDPRTSASIGKVSYANPPTTKEDITTQFGSVRRGLFWYKTSGGVRALYKLDIVDASPAAPAVVINGVNVKEGNTYFNTHDDLLYTFTQNQWTASSGTNDLTTAWVEVNLTELLADLYLEIETRLYDVVPTQPLVFDFDSLIQTPEDQAEYDRLYAERFLSFVRAGDIVTPFVNVDYQPSNAFTWNYSSSTISLPPRSDISPAAAASWQEMYVRWYGTPYPHLEPWKLQGYNDKPTWWDQEYAATSGARRWKYTHSTTLGSAVGMWENIRVGRVPTGYRLPTGAVSTGATGQVPTYRYFSVNISNQTVGQFPSDSLLPPYFQVNSTDPTTRSLFGVYTGEINSPDADYVFGDVGPAEWEWKTSVQYIFDRLIIAFLMQPVRFLHASFGPKFINVDGLQVETLFKQVYSHEDVLFHGDIYDTNKVYSSRGLNQWYVNFNRDVGFDTNAEFRTMWASWKPRLTYQFGGIIDTSTFEIANKYMDIIGPDYNILLANNGVFKDMWADAFDVKLLSSPPPIIQYNNEHAWKLELNTMAAISRPINYYGVKQYTQQSDPVLSTPVRIVSVTTDNDFVIAGNVAMLFPPQSEFEVDGSDTDDGTYTVVSAHFNGSQTFISVAEPIPSRP